VTVFARDSAVQDDRGRRVVAKVHAEPESALAQLSWPSWFALAPSLGDDVLVVATSAPEHARVQVAPALAGAPDGPWAGVVLADGGADLPAAGDLVRPGGWLLVGGPARRRLPAGFVVVERYVPVPTHRRDLATIPLAPGGGRLVLRTLFLPYAPPGRGRRLRRTAMLVLPPLLGRVPVRLLAWLCPSRLVLLRRLP
jgi:hypothetical protein